MIDFKKWHFCEKRIKLYSYDNRATTIKVNKKLLENAIASCRVCYSGGGNYQIMIESLQKHITENETISTYFGDLSEPVILIKRINDNWNDLMNLANKGDKS